MRIFIVGAKDCALVVKAPYIFVHNQAGREEMYYHWHSELFEPLYYSLSSIRHTDLLTDRHTHIVLTHNLNTRFFHYFGLLSDVCPRSLANIPNNTCYTNKIEEKWDFPAANIRKRSKALEAERAPKWPRSKETLELPYDAFIKSRLLPPALLETPHIPKVAWISRR